LEQIEKKLDKSFRRKIIRKTSIKPPKPPIKEKGKIFEEKPIMKKEDEIKPSKKLGERPRINNKKVTEGIKNKRKEVKIKPPEVIKGAKLFIQRTQLPKITKQSYKEEPVKVSEDLVDRIIEDIRTEKIRKLKALLQKYIKDKNYKKIYSLLIWLNTGDIEDLKNNFAIKFKEDPEEVVNELFNELKSCRIKSPHDKIDSESVEAFIREELIQNNIFDFLYEMCKNGVLNSSEFVRKSVWLLSQYGSSCYPQGYLKTLSILSGESVNNIEEKLIELGLIFKVKEKWRYVDSKWVIPEYALRFIEEIKQNPSMIVKEIDKEKLKRTIEELLKKDNIKTFLIKLYQNRYLKQDENESYEDFIKRVGKEWNITSLQEILDILIKNGILLINYSPAWSSRRYYYPAYYIYEITPFASEIVKSCVSKIMDSTAEKPPEKEEEISKEEFEAFEVDRIWISNLAPLVTKDEPNIILINGVDGMGFNVIKGLLRLEIEDRGHEPNLIILRASEEEKYHEISEIEDKIAYNRIVCLSGSSGEWINLEIKEKKEKKLTSISREIEQALSKGTLRHIVIENKIPVKESHSVNLDIYEESEKIIKDLTDKPITEINLIYSPRGMDLKELDIKEIDENTLKELTKIFAKILQAKLSNEKIEEIIASSFYRDRKDIAGKIDAIWDKVEAEKNSAIDELINKFGPSSKVFEILPRSERLENESWEHFVIKLLVIKELLKRGYQDLEVERRSEIKGAKWELVEKDGINCTKAIEVEKEIRDESGKIIKRPDILVNYPKKIWIEVETCKSLEFPLDFVFDKLSKIDITRINPLDIPDELWIVLPFRKIFIYGKELIKKKLYEPFKDYYKVYKKFKVSIFLADLLDERLIELRF